MAVKKISLKGKKWYAEYKNSGQYFINRKLKLERHLKKFLNDEKAQAALKDIKYRRKSPIKKVWTPAKMAYAQILRKAGQNGHIALQEVKYVPDENNKVTEKQ